MNLSAEYKQVEKPHVEWERFTFKERMLRYLVYVLGLTAFFVSLQTMEVIPEFLYDAPEQAMDLFKRMWPLDVGYYPGGIHRALIETLHIATLGTILTLILAIPIGFMGAHNVTPYVSLNWIAKLLLVSSRSVNSLVWALLFVAIFGPGALAGVLALAFRSIGFVGKLFAESLESADMGVAEALKATGAPWGSIILKGYWPQVMPSFWAIVLFRWDINVRESAVLGLVGAGGIGVVLGNEINMFNWDRVAVALLSIFAVVIVAEIFIVNVRKRII